MKSVRTEVGPLLSQTQYKVCDFYVVLGGGHVEDSVASRQLDRNGQVDALVCGGDSAERGGSGDGRALHDEQLNEVVVRCKRERESVVVWKN